MKNILKENMHRFNTKNLNEDHPGIVLPAAMKAGGALIAVIKTYSELFSGKSSSEQANVRALLNIQTMIMNDTDPDKILEYIKSIDSNIDDTIGIHIMKTLGAQLGVYVDTENPDDATPLN
jgi:hypothetical protein